MANSKNALLRLRVIDRCLRKTDGCSTAEIFDEVNLELRKRGEMEVSSMNTIRADIDFISDSWCVPIEEIVRGRRHAYCYRDPDFSIASAPLSPAEREQLEQTMLLLSRFSGLPEFGWLEETKARLGEAFLAPERQQPVVAFENNVTADGMRCFEALFKAVTAQQTVKITYAAFKTNKKTDIEVFPYFLKQYNSRWFLLAGAPGFSTLGNYAVDRVLEVAPSETPFCPSSVDFGTYFDDIIGVTFPEGAEPEEVRLWVSEGQYRYIADKPLHPSQRCIATSDDGVVISINVIPNYELIQKILIHGDGMRVLAPQSLCLLMKEKVAAMLKKYEQVQID